MRIDLILLWPFLLPFRLMTGMIIAIVAVLIMFILFLWALFCVKGLKLRRIGNITTTHGWGWLTAPWLWVLRLRPPEYIGLEAAKATLRKGRVAAAIGNHPKIIDTFDYVIGLSRLAGVCWRALLCTFKHEHLNNIFGKAASATGGMPLRRGQGRETVNALKAWLKGTVQTFRNPFVSIFLEGSRFNKKRKFRRLRNKARAALVQEGATDLLHYFDAFSPYILPPRVGGFSGLVEAAEGDVDVIFIWVANTARYKGILGLFYRWTGRARVKFEAVPLPVDRSFESLRRWLFRAYAERFVPFAKETWGIN